MDGKLRGDGLQTRSSADLAKHDTLRISDPQRDDFNRMAADIERGLLDLFRQRPSRRGTCTVRPWYDSSSRRLTPASVWISIGAC